MQDIGTICDAFGGVAFRIFISHAHRRANSFRVHKHTAFEISLILSGRGMYSTEGGILEIAQGDVFLFGTNEQHCITDIVGEDMTLLNLHIAPGFVWSTGSDYLGNDYLKIFFDRAADFQNRLDRAHPRMDEVRDRILAIREIIAERAIGYAVLVKVKLLELLLLLYREFRLANDDTAPLAMRHTERMERALSYIHENLFGAITLDAIAKAVYMPRTYFSAVFKKMNGMTPWQYINIRRIEHAMQLLRTTDDTVLDIAVKCGYHNTANFNKIFRSVTAQTPSEYRKRHR